MEWRAITSGSHKRGIYGIMIIPAEGPRPTREEWETIRNIVEQAIKKANGLN